MTPTSIETEMLTIPELNGGLLAHAVELKWRKQMNNNGFTLYELLIGIAILSSIALSIGTVVVAIHFITKFW
jgi:prepilin-type N-terminal cleavage/methylation domain-containing protein